MSKLVRECEATLEGVVQVPSVMMVAETEDEEYRRMIELRTDEVTVPGEAIFRNTVAALLTMEEIRRGSSTYGHFSLPPLDLHDSELAHLASLSHSLH